MKNIQDLVKNNKELFWDIGNLSKIDDIIIRDKKRSNLSKKTINFFNLYYNV